jgi:glutamate-ammonia-ligase adenylyltransferase
VAENFAKAHGHMRDEESAVIAMGKLGGCEMTATSDLDLILVYDFNGEDQESDGERPLYGTQYFARLTQRLINALTAQTNYGALYQVDMRLRPSGRAGPLAKPGPGSIWRLPERGSFPRPPLSRSELTTSSGAFCSSRATPP